LFIWGHKMDKNNKFDVMFNKTLMWKILIPCCGNFLQNDSIIL
jgi:hypothetical protein